MGLKHPNGPDPLRDLTDKYIGNPIKNFFKKPKAPGEDPATVNARNEQINQLGKINDQQNYLVKKLMLAQRAFRPFGAPGGVSASSAGGSSVFGAPGVADGSPANPGIGGGGAAARLFGSLRSRGVVPGNFGNKGK